MDATLTQYVARAEELLRDKATNKKKILKNVNELTIMLDFLTRATKSVRERLSSYKKLHEPPEVVAAKHGPATVVKLDDLESATPCQLVWVPELNQYSIRINHILLRGNLGNIYDRKCVNNPKVSADQIVLCRHGNGCPNILRQEYCKFYHDPLDLSKLVSVTSQGISLEFYKHHVQNYPRNFSNTSWMYSATPQKHMRSLGTKSTLETHAAYFRATNPRGFAAELETLKAQIMHDILVLLHAESIN